MPTKTRAITDRHLLSLSLATSITVGMMSTVPSKAVAFGFTGSFAPSNWTLTNTNANGSVDTTSAATGTIVLTGGDNGSNLPGTTDWTIPIDLERFYALKGGNISFNWSYFTLDTPGFDSAGFLLNGVYTPLAVKDGEFSTSPVSLNVVIGDVFGFRAETSTNTDGPPVFSVYAPVPEPLTIMGAGIVLGALPVLKKKYDKSNKKKDEDA